MLTSRSARVPLLAGVALAVAALLPWLPGTAGAAGAAGAPGASAPPEGAIPWEDGFLLATRHRTIARWQPGLGRADFDIALGRARERALQEPPRVWRTLFVVVRKIDADWKDAGGTERHTTTSIDDDKLERCLAWFDKYKDLVAMCSDGALAIQEDFLDLPGPVRRLDPMGPGVYWLSPQTALEGVQVRQGWYDSVIVYYRPGDIPMGLLGGTFGKDHGVAGAGVSSLQIPDGFWAEEDPLFTVAGVATFHEWLHQVSYCARQVMGYRDSPDCHCAEEYGWTSTDGGHREWFAFYRGLTRSLYPPAFWRDADMEPGKPPGAPPELDRPVPGPFFAWDQVRDDWQRRLPRLTEAFLRERTGLPGLTLSIGQYRSNDYCQLVVGGLPVEGMADAVLSPVARAAEHDTALNNVLSMGRPQQGPSVDEPWGGQRDATLESMAVVRYRTDSPGSGEPPSGPPSGHRDLVFLRMDVAGPVLAMLRTRDDAAGDGGATAANRLLGYLSLPDPSEGHPLVFLVVDVDLGEDLPADELAAIGRP